MPTKNRRLGNPAGKQHSLVIGWQSVVHLQPLLALYTIYLENNPISTDPENAWQKNADYKREVKHLLPSIKQIDASDVTMFGTTLLLEHAMKVVERIFEHRIRQQIKIDDMQFGFMKGSTMIRMGVSG